MKHRYSLLLGLVVVVAALAGTVVALNLRGESPVTDDPAPPAGAAAPELLARGAYLARAGNCIGCHTQRGGTPYAGGRGIETPFGTVYASNLTPDAETGLGDWNASHFWRALHNGRSRDGRLLYPAFPYTHYTRVTRADSDALFAFLRSLPAIRAPQRPHALRFPYDSQAALAVWRALYFTPAAHQDDPSRPAEWNRGAYLVRGLGHCSACHAARNALGALRDEAALGGAALPMQDWYAPSLSSPAEAGLAAWDTARIVQLLKTGQAPGASVLGPMAEVVLNSTQHLKDADLQAMAAYLRSLPQAPPPQREPVRRDAALMARGQGVYEQRCADCHGDDGRGVAGIYPALAGNRAVTMDSPANVIAAIASGGYPPATPGNPRPFGMPPFGHELTPDDLAAVTTYVRGSWGNDAPQVTPFDLTR
jgi:mono/diheme cytochrome c family protein